MVARKILSPNPEHPIDISANPKRIIVRIGDTVIADTRTALALRESAYPTVQYIRREDVDMRLLTRSAHTSYCPYKGDANYFNVDLLGQKGENAVWTYESPYAAVASIGARLAFYADRFTISQET